MNSSGRSAAQVSLAELEGRIRRVQVNLRRDGLDAALVVENVDLLYLSGTMQQGQLLLPAEGEPVFLVRKDLDRARHESPLVDIRPISSLRQLPAVLADAGLDSWATLGMELDVIPVNLFERYRALLPGVSIGDCSPAVRDARAIKTTHELRLMAEAARQVDQVMQEAARVLRPGMTEVELAAHLECFARRQGHQGVARFRGFNQELFFGHVFAGPAAAEASGFDTPLGGRGLSPAMPQGPSRRPIGVGEPVVVDFSGCVDGYLVDQTRVLSLGALDADLKAAYAVCEQIQTLIKVAAVEGRACGDLYAFALHHAGDRGLAASFMGASPNQVPYIGHGVGLEIDEPPHLAKGSARLLERGNVIAVEPKLVFPGKGVVGVENTWLVGETGLTAVTVSREGVWEL